MLVLSATGHCEVFLGLLREPLQNSFFLGFDEAEEPLQLACSLDIIHAVKEFLNGQENDFKHRCQK